MIKKNIDTIKFYDTILKMSYEDFIKNLIENKINLKIKNELGENLYHQLIKTNQIDKFYALIYLKKDIKTNNKGENILHYSLKYSNDIHISQEIAKKYVSPLEENHNGENAFFYAQTAKDIIYLINYAKLNKININNMKNKENLTIKEFNIVNNLHFVNNIWNKYK